MSRRNRGREVTHRPDPDDGHMVQLVSPRRLRQILDEDGDSYDPPMGFGANDECNVEQDT